MTRWVGSTKGLLVPERKLLFGGSELSPGEYTVGDATEVIEEEPPRTAPTYQSSEIGLGAGTVNRPSGVSSGAFLWGCFLDFMGAGTVINVPTGWTPIGAQFFTTSGLTPITARMAYKVAGSSEPSNYVYGATPSDFPLAFVVSYRNVDNANPIADVGSLSGNGTTRSVPSLTATSDNSMLVIASLGHDGGNIVTVPTGMSARVDILDIQGVFDQTIAVAGATGVRTHQTGNGPSWLTLAAVINGAPA